MIPKTRIKYTPEQEEELLREYNACTTFEERDEVIAELAEKWRKTPRMLIAKLSNMDVYIKKPTISKVTGGKPETKESMVHRLEVKYGVPKDTLISVTKASKLAIRILLQEK